MRHAAHFAPKCVRGRAGRTYICVAKATARRTVKDVIIVMC